MDWKEVFEWPWVAAHYVNWLLIGAWLGWFFNPMPVAWLLVTVAYGSIAWEAVESGRHWHEHWANRLIVDPVTNTLGAISGWVLTTYVVHL